MAIIDPYEVYLEKTFGESHQVNNNPFGVLCEGSGQTLELDKLQCDPKGGESLFSFSESYLHSLLNFPSSSCYSISHFLPQSSSNLSLADDAIISFHSHIYISPLERWIEQSCTPTFNPSHHTLPSFFHLHPSSILEF